RTDRPEEAIPLAAQAAVRCGGFRVLFEDGQADVRQVPGTRQLPPGLTAAVLQGLAQAPRRFAEVLGLRPPRRPYDRVEVSLDTGESTQGEAVPVGLGCIRLVVGEGTTPEDASRIALHEALHLLLAASLPGGARWNRP